MSMRGKNAAGIITERSEGALRGCLNSSLISRLRVSARFGLWHPLPLWERSEVRGFTLIPTFSHQGRRGSYQAILGCVFFDSSLDYKPGFKRAGPFPAVTTPEPEQGIRSGPCSPAKSSKKARMRSGITPDMVSENPQAARANRTGRYPVVRTTDPPVGADVYLFQGLP